MKTLYERFVGWANLPVFQEANNAPDPGLKMRPCMYGSIRLRLHLDQSEEQINIAIPFLMFL